MLVKTQKIYNTVAFICAAIMITSVTTGYTDNDQSLIVPEQGNQLLSDASQAIISTTKDSIDKIYNICRCKNGSLDPNYNYIPENGMLRIIEKSVSTIEKMSLLKNLEKNRS